MQWFCSGGQLRFHQPWRRHAGAQQLAGQERPKRRKHPPTSDRHTAGNTFLPTNTALHTQADCTGCVSVCLTHHFERIFAPLPPGLRCVSSSGRLTLQLSVSRRCREAAARRQRGGSAPCCPGGAAHRDRQGAAGTRRQGFTLLLLQ